MTQSKLSVGQKTLSKKLTQEKTYYYISSSKPEVNVRKIMLKRRRSSFNVESRTDNGFPGLEQFNLLNSILSF